MKTESFFISCPKGLEESLAQELTTEKSTIRPGGCYFSATPAEAINILLNSRIGSRAYRRVSKFHINDTQELHRKALNFEWDTIMDLNQTFKVTTLFDGKAKALFKNSVAISQILKDAVCDYFRKKSGKRPDVDLKRATVKLLLRIEREESGFKAIILVDMCGTPLSNRGYRIKGHAAPLRENLAAGIIKLTNWDPEKEILIDSMCGSGTFLIEAAMIKMGLPPAQLNIRRFVEKGHHPWDFLRHKWYKTHQQSIDDLIQNHYNQIIKLFNEDQKCRIYGFDQHYPSIKIAQANLDQAYLPNKLVHIEKKDALTLEPPKETRGIIICNPPYGKRLTTELEDLYYQYGENLKKNFDGFRAYIFTGNLPLRKKISLQTSARIALHNGDIECRLLKYDLYSSSK